MSIDFKQEKNNLENVEIKEVAGKGIGMFAKKDFAKGEKIWYLNGGTINYATDYTIPINELEKVEPRISGSIGQFMNNSCEPNIGPQNERDYVAMRDIEKGEELFTHYGFLGYEYGEEKSIDGKERKIFDLTCRCGTESSKGKLGCYKYLTDQEREKWKDHILPFLNKK